MKPGRNHLIRKGKLTDFTWRYYERKVGTYLDLYTPLTASPDGKLGWRTRMVWRPYSEWWVRRLTSRLCTASMRTAPNGFVCSDTVVLDLKPTKTETIWETVSEDRGLTTERAAWRRVLEWSKPFRFRTTGHPKNESDSVTDVDPGVPIEQLHESFSEVLAGCAEHGNFIPLVDWTSENVTCVSSLFHEAGVP